MSMLSISKKSQHDVSLVKKELEVKHNRYLPPSEFLVFKTLKLAALQHESGKA